MLLSQLFGKQLLPRLLHRVLLGLLLRQLLLSLLIPVLLGLVLLLSQLPSLLFGLVPTSQLRFDPVLSQPPKQLHTMPPWSSAPQPASQTALWSGAHQPAASQLSPPQPTPQQTIAPQSLAPAAPWRSVSRPIALPINTSPAIDYHNPCTSPIGQLIDLEARYGMGNEQNEWDECDNDLDSNPDTAIMTLNEVSNKLAELEVRLSGFEIDSDGQDKSGNALVGDEHTLEAR
ncbi:hypothetical protein B0J13DRAFT_251698 [Dactylonectria estremocensis]|uniref:Uncharacterized protein n=1 Tax=Dactylonectria estremocensis TaxID=1079267 RepID=A0A9P9F338_9HYPO|nr:hypothetical protein B0J13DRAFT_251698 [Dactylonectria estremocensis]